MASDASADQIRAAPPVEGVTFRVAPAQASGLPNASVDLVLVAQALHWFPLKEFYREVNRVVRPGGVLATLCYGLMTISEEVDPIVSRLYHQDLAEYWPEERRHVDQGYGGLPFPFTPLPAPEHSAMEASWTLEQTVGYLGTWSALRRCRRDTGDDPLQRCLPQLARAWGAPRTRTIRWPLHVKVGTS